MVHKLCALVSLSVRPNPPDFRKIHRPLESRPSAVLADRPSETEARPTLHSDAPVRTVAQTSDQIRIPISVLIIEDDDLFRAKLESWLRAESRFACVGSCADGETGLREILARKPALAIVDYALPEMYGDAVIWHAKLLLPGLKALVISGVPGDHVVFDSLDAGADGFLDKPIKAPAALFFQVDEVLAGKFPLADRACQLLVQSYQESRPKPWLMALLTDREKEVAELTCHGLANGAIAHKLGISLDTVQTHQKTIHSKLEVHSRVELQIKLYGLKRPPPIQP